MDPCNVYMYVCMLMDGCMYVINNIYACTYIREKKDTKSQSEHNFICVQSSYMFRLYIAIIRLNKEL